MQQDSFVSSILSDGYGDILARASYRGGRFSDYGNASNVDDHEPVLTSTVLRSSLNNSENVVDANHSASGSQKCASKQQLRDELNNSSSPAIRNSQKTMGEQFEPLSVLNYEKQNKEESILEQPVIDEKELNDLNDKFGDFSLDETGAGSDYEDEQQVIGITEEAALPLCGHSSGNSGLLLSRISEEPADFYAAAVSSRRRSASSTEHNGNSSRQQPTTSGLLKSSGASDRADNVNYDKEARARCSNRSSQFSSSSSSTGSGLPSSYLGNRSCSGYSEPGDRGSGDNGSPVSETEPPVHSVLGKGHFTSDAFHTPVQSEAFGCGGASGDYNKLPSCGKFEFSAAGGQSFGVSSADFGNGGLANSEFLAMEEEENKHVNQFIQEDAMQDCGSESASNNGSDWYRSSAFNETMPQPNMTAYLGGGSGQLPDSLDTFVLNKRPEFGLDRSILSPIPSIPKSLVPLENKNRRFLSSSRPDAAKKISFSPENLLNSTLTISEKMVTSTPISPPAPGNNSTATTKRSAGAQEDVSLRTQDQQTPTSTGVVTSSKQRESTVPLNRNSSSTVSHQEICLPDKASALKSENMAGDQSIFSITSNLVRNATTGLQSSTGFDAIGLSNQVLNRSDSCHSSAATSGLTENVNYALKSSAKERTMPTTNRAMETAPGAGATVGCVSNVDVKPMLSATNGTSPASALPISRNRDDDNFIRNLEPDGGLSGTKDATSSANISHQNYNSSASVSHFSLDPSLLNSPSAVNSTELFHLLNNSSISDETRQLLDAISAAKQKLKQATSFSSSQRAIDYSSTTAVYRNLAVVNNTVENCGLKSITNSFTRSLVNDSENKAALAIVSAKQDRVLPDCGSFDSDISSVKRLSEDKDRASTGSFSKRLSSNTSASGNASTSRSSTSVSTSQCSSTSGPLSKQSSQSSNVSHKSEKEAKNTEAKAAVPPKKVNGSTTSFNTTLKAATCSGNVKATSTDAKNGKSNWQNQTQQQQQRVAAEQSAVSMSSSSTAVDWSKNLLRHKYPLYFGCVDVHQSATQTTVLRNATTEDLLRLDLRIKSERCNSVFSILNNSSVDSGTVMIRPKEDFTLPVSFRPDAPILYKAKILMKPTSSRQTLGITVWGFGGTCKLSFVNTDESKGSNALLNFKCSSDAGLQQQLTRTVVLRNSGLRDAFVKLVPYSDEFCISEQCNVVSVQPNAFVLKASDSIPVKITFTNSNTERVVYSSSQMLSYICVYYGEEILRQRCRKMFSAGDGTNQLFVNGVDLSSHFQNESIVTENLQIEPPCSKLDFSVLQASIRKLVIHCVARYSFCPMLLNNSCVNNYSSSFLPLGLDCTNFSFSQSPLNILSATRFNISPVVNTTKSDAELEQHNTDAAASSSSLITVVIDNNGFATSPQQQQLNFPITAVGDFSVLKLCVKNPTAHDVKMMFTFEPPSNAFRVKHSSYNVRPQYFINMPIYFEPSLPVLNRSALIIRNCNTLTSFELRISGMGRTKKKT